jgi:hypothetical protein
MLAIDSQFGGEARDPSTPLLSVVSVGMTNYSSRVSTICGLFKIKKVVIILRMTCGGQ